MLLFYSLFFLGICSLLFLVYRFLVLHPGITKNWEVGFENPPKITQKENTVTIQHVRDNRFLSPQHITNETHTREIQVNDIQNMWFVIEPFPLVDFFSFGGVAHTYFVFDIKNQHPLAVSVEARREKGEEYNAFWGIFNSYELMYVWAEEEDITGKRVLVEENGLYMYPLLLSREDTQKLFLQMVKTTKELETTPRFYNTLFSNCTNELAKNANKVAKGAIPFNIALFLPGFADRKLYDYGYIPHHKPFEEIKKQYYISDIVKKIYKEKDFSQKLREAIEKKNYD